MFKITKIISAVTAMALLSSCAFMYDIENPQYLEFAEVTESPTEEIEDIPVFEDFNDYSDYHDYFDYIDISDTEDNSDEIISDNIEVPTEEAEESEKITENSTEAETEEQTEAPVTTKTASKKKTPEPDYKAAKCIEVPYLSQEKYPTGCELVSTAMMLSYYDIEIEPIQLIEKGYIDTVEVQRKNGKLYGGNPNEVFVGNPRKNTGYGCYSPAIKKCLEKLLEDDFFDVYSLNGMSLPDICAQYIDFGQPVVIWASIDMKPLEKKEDSTWLIEETGEQFSWLSNEHCMVLVGYDDYYYYINDPQKSAFTPYKRSTVEKRYSEMGSQAVAVIPW